MTRSLVLARSPMLLTLFPFGVSDRDYDKPVNASVATSLGQTTYVIDEYGWDRVKKVFQLTEHHTFTKEFRSILTTSMAGFVGGMCLGGMLATKKTVDEFIANNEATRFPSAFDAKRSLQNAVAANFVKTGYKIGGKLALFCGIFSCVTTSTTAYRGKFAIGNYILGGFVTGLLLKINLGLRGGLVGAGIGSLLGGLGGCVTVLGCKITGVSMDQLLSAQQEWQESRDEAIREKAREYLNKETIEIKQLYNENQEIISKK